MILFVPGYDPATEANLAIAVRIAGRSRALLSDEATRERLLEALAEPGDPLFAMTHGRSDRLLAQNGVTGLGQPDATALGSRSIFAFACHTATDLGRSFAQAGAAWWGYTGTISAPDSAPELLPVFSEIFAYLLAAFEHADSTEERLEVLIELAERCHTAERRIDDLLETDPDLDAGTAYLCLLHLWDRLRIWEEGKAGVPLQHPASKPPLLFP